ncbi:hypothetical protein M8C21_025585 [Ambrosia artemisiifolia]|uniref:RING-type domain-containing protein n=1 Tax=Ambrosia artemisiifolia TaxID=4212 RepID=A0AAD5D5L2_AMBAR|nr:hypothetical protein M8C21_025585 [Ambrosia artemisiifolia]
MTTAQMVKGAIEVVHGSRPVLQPASNITTSDSSTDADLGLQLTRSASPNQQLLPLGRTTLPIHIVADDNFEPKHLPDHDNMFLITKVGSGEKLIKLPKNKISNHNILDTSGNETCCSVCLQDFEVGNSAGTFPKCEHKFHPECIYQWLLTNNSCPVCRTTI